MKLKRLLTNTFVVLVNYYLLTSFIGILLMLATVFFGPLNIFVVLGAITMPLIACIIYQIKRINWNYDSVGEIIIGNYNKADILDQAYIFSITRIPIFLLLLVILIFNGNLLDGIGSRQVYTIPNVILFFIIFLTTYNGIRNFFLKQDTLSIMVFAGGLLYVAFAFKKTALYEIYYCFTVLWLLVSFMYKWKTVKISSSPTK